MFKPEINAVYQPEQAATWRQQLKEAIQKPQQLRQMLGLPVMGEEESRAADRAQQHFKLRVPLSFVRRMRMGNPNDPLLLQVLPTGQELLSQPGFNNDPVGDLNSTQAPGLLHKYQGRVLLITTGACAINCRYCFRREFPYSEQVASKQQFQAAIDYIAAHPDIEEVILSGGDPLLLGTHQLTRLTQALSDIPHIQRLRIHTRLPIVLPDRVTPNLLQWTQNLPWPLVVVVHCNHAQELDEETKQALLRWRQAGAHMLNQSVLLKDINDNATAQKALARALLDASTFPYYLHLLDKVNGSAHFDVKTSKAEAITDILRRELSGYLVPRLVREQAGAPYKLPVL